jgi:hypothetical protein
MRRRIAMGTGIALLVIGAGLGFWIYQRLQLTPPTELSLDPNNLAALSPPLPNPPIVTYSQDADAGPDYRQAIAAYEANTDACDQYAQNPVDPAPQAIQLILSAAEKSIARLFITNPSQIVDYQTDHPPLDDLCELARTIDRAALLLLRQGKTDAARGYFQSVYALGEKLYDERLTYDEYSKGLSLMNESTIGLSECERGDQAAQLQKQEAAMRDYDVNHVQPIYEALVSADQQEIAQHAGDIFQFAAHAADRMIQVEAVLALGRLQYDAARSADQQAAAGYIRAAAASPDPAVQAAAAAAGGLTLEQYRTIH